MLSKGTLYITLRFSFYTVVALVAILLSATTWQVFHLPPIEQLLLKENLGGSTILDRYNQPFAWRGPQFDTVDIEKVSPHLINAILAIEDRRFFKHPGIDPRGIFRAILRNYRAGAFVEGGSTITQQTAKLVFLNSEKTLDRKFLELPLAFAMEWRYSKIEILSIYLNRVYLGAGSYGFEAAAQRYFGKSAQHLSFSESAMLAGLLQAPSRYSPAFHMRNARNRAITVLNTMEEEGYLSADEKEIAIRNPAQLLPTGKGNWGNYFADWVWNSTPEWLIKSGTDVIIRTTFDQKIQSIVEKSVYTVLKKHYGAHSPAQAAVIVASPKGEVYAMVGGLDYKQSPFNRATRAKRQPGSAFKVVVYAAALENGLRPSDLAYDGPVSLKNTAWSPKNYNGKFNGEITLTEAFADSINTVAVRISERVGHKKIKEMAVRLGAIPKRTSIPGPSVALGVMEVSLLNMTRVYASIANQGNVTEPYGIRSISLKNDEVLLRNDTRTSKKVMSKKTAASLTSMLEMVIKSGTGRRAFLSGHPAAGKTGTSQNSRDAWFIGFTGNYITSVWIGSDTNASLKDVTGGTIPATIWHTIMTQILEDKKPIALANDGSYAHMIHRKNNNDRSKPEIPNSININEIINQIMTPQ